MKGTKLNARKKLKRRRNRRLVRSVVAYLKSDGYLFAPLFSVFPPLTTQVQTHPPSNSESSKTDDIFMEGFDALGIERVSKKKRRMSETVKEYLKSDCHMYGPIISPLKLGSSLKGKLQITNLVTMEVSSSTTSMREDKIYMNLRSDIGGESLHNGRVNSPKRAMVILEGQRTGLSREADLSPAFTTLPEEKMVKPELRRGTIKSR